MKKQAPSSTDMQKLLEEWQCTVNEGYGIPLNISAQQVVIDYIRSLEKENSSFAEEGLLSRHEIRKLEANVEAHRRLLENAKRIFDKVPVRDWDEVLANSENVLSSLQFHES